MTTSFTDSPMSDAELERRLTAALDVMIPRLASGEDTDRVGHDDHVGEWDDAPEWDVSPGPQRLTRAGSSPRPRSRRLVAAAAAVLIVGGVAALAGIQRSGGTQPSAATNPPDTTPTTDPVVPVTSNPSLLHATPAATDPLRIVSTMPGWRIESWTGEFVDEADPADVSCPGCRATRLIVATPGASLAEPLFTAWTIAGEVAPEAFDWPVTINGIGGRFMGAPDDNVAPAENRVTVMWPIGDGRTALVDARGFSNGEVFALAATLDVSGDVPAMATPPPGMVATVSAPAATPIIQYLTMTDGWNTIEVLANNSGVQGLLDWRYPTGQFLIWNDWTTRTIDGVDVAFIDDFTDPPAAIHDSEGNPVPASGTVGSGGAAWVSGDWSFHIIGHRFDLDPDAFVAVVASLQVTDPATFAAATTDALTAFLEPLDS